MNKIFMLVVVAGLAGCSIDLHETALNPPSWPVGKKLYARTPAQVEVFTAGAPARAHTDIVLLEATDTLLASTEDYIAALRDRAAALGCDAVVVTDRINRGSRAAVAGTCIVYQ
jgi:hypothetical protein